LPLKLVFFTATGVDKQLFLLKTNIYILGKMATASFKEFEELSFYDYFAECKIRVKRASANLLAWSVGRSFPP